MEAELEVNKKSEGSKCDDVNKTIARKVGVSPGLRLKGRKTILG